MSDSIDFCLYMANAGSEMERSGIELCMAG